MRCMRSNRKGFTLIELVIVIVILGILAAIALPKFLDIVGDAKQSATKAGLGAIRAVVALKYSKTLATGGTGMPSTIADTDFFDGRIPTNKLVNSTVITMPAAAVTGSASASSGWWYVSGTGTDAGRCGAYGDGVVDTSLW